VSLLLKSSKLLVAFAGIILFLSAGFGVVLQENVPTREEILSRDFKTAREALDENTRNRRVELVQVSLEHPSLLIKRRAAKAIMELDDKDSVPALVEALEKNQVSFKGSSETKALQEKLNNDLVSALHRPTGISFPVEGVLSKYAPSLITHSAADIKQIILITREWLASRDR
jgi:hypothetical protein